MLARLLEFEEIAPETRHFRFEAVGLPRFDFEPGQFVTLRAALGGRPVVRAYSLASPPAGNRFDLCLNRVCEGVFSPYLFERRPGDEIEMRGPYGRFLLREPPGDTVLVATGTGVAPFRSMLLARVPQDPAHRYILILGTRYEAGLLYRLEWEALARDFPNFDFRPALTRPAPGWPHRAGRVQGHLLEALGGRRDADVYICGIKDMVEETRALLEAEGHPKHHIHYEKYD